jgi:hypothetical protein
MECLVLGGAGSSLVAGNIPDAVVVTCITAAVIPAFILILVRTECVACTYASTASELGIVFKVEGVLGEGLDGWGQEGGWLKLGRN